MKILNVLDRKAFILQRIERGRANQGTTMYLSVVHKQANDDILQSWDGFYQITEPFETIEEYSITQANKKYEAPKSYTI